MTLERRTGLRPISAKRRAELAAAGNTNPYSTLTNTGAGLDRAKVLRDVKARPTSTGPTVETVAIVAARDAGRCVRCGRMLGRQRGRDWSVQHRRARQGTDRRPDTNQPQNLVLLCGSATTLCHGWVESYRTAAREGGWAIRQTDDPAAMPVNHAVHGWVLLTADGSFETYTPNHINQPQEATA